MRTAGHIVGSPAGSAVGKVCDHDIAGANVRIATAAREHNTRCVLRVTAKLLSAPPWSTANCVATDERRVRQMSKTPITYTTCNLNEFYTNFVALSSTMSKTLKNGVNNHSNWSVSSPDRAWIHSRRPIIVAGNIQNAGIAWSFLERIFQNMIIGIPELAALAF